MAGRFAALIHGLYFRALVSMRRYGVGRFLWLRRLEVGRLCSLDPATEGVFFAPEPEVRASNISARASLPPREFPAVGFREFSSALVTANPRVSSVVQGNRFLIAESSPDGPWQVVKNTPRVAGLVAQDGDSVLVAGLRWPKAVPQGIFVGSWSPHNWYHWLIDTLPAVAFSASLPEQYKDFPLFLPEVVSSKPNFLEIATRLAGGRLFLPLPNDRYLSVGRLVWVDGATSPGPPSVQRIDSDLYSVHESALRCFRSSVIEAYGMTQVTARFRRVFLARKDNSERPFNHSELVEIAQEEGLEVAYLEDLSVEESIRLFLEAELVVGPHGAGWANGLFLGTGSRVVLLMAEAFRRHNWFVNIFTVAGAEFKVLFGARLSDNNPNSFYVSPNEFRALLRN